MTDMLQSKQAEVDSGAEQTGMDLLGAMIRSAQNSDTGKPLLSDEEILGNAFVFILAGHETTANSIHYSLIYLACNPAMQKKLQADVDDIFQGRKPEEWNYDHDLPKLFSGMVGATMNEQLRLIPPVIEIPKCTRTVQPITIDGKRCTVPANVLINLSTAAAHRNPNSWPHGPPSDPSKPSHPVSNLHNDLEEFKPDRWLLSGGNSAQQAPKHSSKARTEHSEDEQDATGGPTGDTAASLWKPVKGSYLPFSEGARSCIGKRFAQVEVLAVLAVIFNEWSVELALDDFASEEELAKMNESEKKQVWEKARDRAMWVFREKMQSRITLKMQSEIHTPLRFVRRGREDSARM
jgi:cytochrome P450